VEKHPLNRLIGIWLAQFVISLIVVVFFQNPLFAAEGTEGASFLNIPVGARPAALGSSYSALAEDVYAPTWNPGGLGRVDSTQIAGQHLSYLESIYYEYLGFVHPLGNGRSLGGAIQYLGSGDIAGMDALGNATGDFSAYYAAYSLAYGQRLGNRLSLGVTGKMISAKIADVGARAYAVDAGGLYQANSKLSLALVVRNFGTPLTFLDQADSLPLAVHAGAAYRTSSLLGLSAEAVYRKTGLASFHFGTEWTPTPPLALRVGYRTDTTKGLSPLAGLTTGLGIYAWGHEFAYAWLPLGDLGNTQYFSAVLKFGGAPEEKRHLIQYHRIKRDPEQGSEAAWDHALMELLDQTERTTAVQKN
jgi:hypothetical protein